MARVSLVVALAACLPLTHGHFTFVRVSLNGAWQAPTRFIRNKTTPYEEDWTPNTNVNTRLYNYPTYATDRLESTRCGRDSMVHAADTEVLTVQAGDSLEFAHQRIEPDEWTDDMWVNCTYDRGSCDPSKSDGVMDINHPGPFMAHLSKVPDGQEVHTYDGSGEWVKIYTLGLEVKNDSTINWLAYNEQQLPGRFLLKIPEQTPAGQYLLRLDEVNTGIKDTAGAVAQIYPSCAQLEVKSTFTGSLPSGIQIPEDLTDTSPGMALSLDMYRRQKLDEDYVYPGGPLWDGTSLVQDKPVNPNSTVNV